MGQNPDDSGNGPMSQRFGLIRRILRGRDAEDLMKHPREVIGMLEPDLIGHFGNRPVVLLQ